MANRMVLNEIETAEKIAKLEVDVISRIAHVENNAVWNSTPDKATMAQVGEQL